ncbi:dienelactone hydrolase family protein [Paenibacillus lemnae]|uniref:Dienelactone hydrolase n=1 Tax=Paenibacillus lemnae TaxID=1330551 RepID=A0A848M9H2_PAELE|nr:alpha/beta hydrolase family protein [Paenibacillus lemnae]NMO96810.1 dienelactone hydrolase [Paenibacillus lemnae]
MFQADAWMEQQYRKNMEKVAQQTREQSKEQRRRDLTDVMRKLIGEIETGELPAPVITERVSCPGYTRERVILSAAEGLEFGAYILIPDNCSEKALPAVLAIHGHGYGSREIAGMLPDGTADESPPGIHQHFAVQLVRRGVIVIAPDVVGFGERRLRSDTEKNPEAASSCYRMAVQLMMLGKTLTGLRIAELRKAVDYIVSRPEVDSAKIGVMGFSGGGLLAYTAAVLDERLKAIVLTGYTNTYKDSILAVQHCLCNYTPGMLTYAELPEWIGLLCPRPLFLESGLHDFIFPEAGFRKAEAEIQHIYNQAGASERLTVDLFPGGHEISGRKSYDWLCQQLRK